MALEPGFYTLRASPAKGLGGMYATGEGSEQIVRTAAQVPELEPKQIVSSRAPSMLCARPR